MFRISSSVKLLVYLIFSVSYFPGKQLITRNRDPWRNSKIVRCIQTNILLVPDKIYLVYTNLPVREPAKNVSVSIQSDDT